MDELIKLARTFRFARDLPQRLALGEEIIHAIEPDLRLFIIAAISAHASAQDVLQETLVAVITGLARFQGNSATEFWAWCYAIARHKIADHFRRTATETKRVQPMPLEELWSIIEASAATAPLSTGERLDLEYAMKLLAESKPECAQYLWRHFVLGMDYAEIAEDESLGYDSVRMRIARCLEEAQSLMR